MIEFKTTVSVAGITAHQVYDFMLNCNDADYQKWWPGTHFAFHTRLHKPGGLGNVVYFDESVGPQRIKSKAVVVEAVKAQKLVWQLKKGLKLPVWIELSLEDDAAGVGVLHIMKAGFPGRGSMFDIFFRLILNHHFERELNEHVRTEFSLMGKLFASLA
ncbi:MAG: hypothetical protein K9M55_00360 [Candidatus Marinimicrobia bacterium]|nr:hypothetical protein [Candidatus Neomarinimicrobiota bacterium]